MFDSPIEDSLLHCAQAAGPGQIDFREPERASEEMDMRVVESGNHKAACRFDNACLRPPQCIDLPVSAHGCDMRPPHGDGLRPRLCGFAVQTRPPRRMRSAGWPASGTMRRPSRSRLRMSLK